MLRHTLRFTAPTALAAALAACAPAQGPSDLAGAGSVRHETLSDILSAPASYTPADHTPPPLNAGDAQILHVNLISRGGGDYEFARLSVDATHHGWDQAQFDVASCWRAAAQAGDNEAATRRSARTVDELTAEIDLNDVKSCLSERDYAGVFMSSPITGANGPFGGVTSAPRPVAPLRTTTVELKSFGLRGLSTPAPTPDVAAADIQISADDEEIAVHDDAIPQGPEAPHPADEPVAADVESKSTQHDVAAARTPTIVGPFSPAASLPQLQTLARLAAGGSSDALPAHAPRSSERDGGSGSAASYGDVTGYFSRNPAVEGLDITSEDPSSLDTLLTAAAAAIPPMTAHPVANVEGYAIASLDVRSVSPSKPDGTENKPDPDVAQHAAKEPVAHYNDVSTDGPADLDDPDERSAPREVAALSTPTSPPERPTELAVDFPAPPPVQSHPAAEALEAAPVAAAETHEAPAAPINTVEMSDPDVPPLEAEPVFYPASIVGPSIAEATVEPVAPALPDPEPAPAPTPAVATLAPVPSAEPIQDHPINIVSDPEPRRITAVDDTVLLGAAPSTPGAAPAPLDTGPAWIPAPAAVPVPRTAEGRQQTLEDLLATCTETTVRRRGVILVTCTD